MPILDPGRQRPEVDQALDLSPERPTADRPPVEVEQVSLDVNTPVASFKAVIGIGGRMAPAFSVLAVGCVAAGLAYVIKYFVPPLTVAIVTVVALISGFAFVDRWRRK
jgi:hypothetical protein